MFPGRILGSYYVPTALLLSWLVLRIRYCTIFIARIGKIKIKILLTDVKEKRYTFIFYRTSREWETRV